MLDESVVTDAVHNASPQDLERYGGDLFHAIPAPALLLVVQVLNLDKPPGMTPYGWRKNRSERLARSAVQVPSTRAWSA